MKLEIVIQKVRDGRDYVQILSDDYISVNILLIAEQISVKDLREKKP